MAIVTTKRQSWAVEIEDTEGVYKAPTAGTSFVQTLAEGAELSRSKEQIERNIFNNSIGQTSPRTGMFTASGTLPVEFKSHSTQGAAPEFDKLMQSALGGKRQISSEVTTLTGNTASVLKVTDASVFKVGDIVLVKEAGKFHVSPISAVDTTLDTIILLVAADSAFSDGVVIAKSTIYTVADEGHPSLSISRYLNGEILQNVTGAKVNSMSLEGFSTGQLPSLSFGFEGLNFDSSLTTIPFTPAYDSQLPPIVMDGRVYMSGSLIDVNEVTLSLENTLGFQTSINAVNGRTSGWATNRTITGSFNPYMQDDTMANFTKFKQNTPFSLFAYAKLPSSTAGEFGGVVAIYAPNCVITDLTEADADGLLQENITFSANRGSSGTIDEIYIAFI